jgi:hypothetical protein
LFKKTEENSFYIKYQDGIVTDYDALTEFFYNYRKSKYEKEYKKPYPDERVTVTDYKITNYTSDKIIAQRTNYFEEGQLKLKLSEWNLIIDLNTNTVDFSINSYNAKQELEKRTNFKYFCQPLNYISQESKGSDKQNTKSNQAAFQKYIRRCIKEMKKLLIKIWNGKFRNGQNILACKYFRQHHCWYPIVIR